jgi:trans-aconitate 2-methyltransferase
VTTPVDWDASTYDRVAGLQEEWGREVLARLDLRGDETVLDAGCGSGRVTKHLAARVPRGTVIGVDGSPSMIEEARKRLETDAGEDAGRLSARIELIVADLLTLELPEPVDAIFSNAAFHWIRDHDRLFRRLHGLLLPGGALEAQCGGQGNIAEFERAVDAICGDERFAPYLRGERRAWNFASPADTETRLARAGFADLRIRLVPKRVSPSQPRDFLRASALAWHLDRLPPELHDEFIDAVVGSMPRPLVLEYVRLNISARRR